MGVRVQSHRGMHCYLVSGFLTLLFSAALTLAACGRQSEDAVAAYKRGDYEKAYRLFKPMAEKGDAKAQFNIGFMYDNGQGVSQDHTEAMKWYRRAAEQGDALAQYNLGYLYIKGAGVPQDETEGAKWYRKAAEQGYIAAQRELGSMYYLGRGVPQGFVEAATWMRKAAEQGDAEAQQVLGILYNEGQGVTQNYILSHMWFNLAASRLPEENRAMAVEDRDRVASKMTPYQVAEAQRLAREWKPKNR